MVRRRFVVWLTILGSFCALLLGALGYRAIRDADRSSRLLAQRTAQDAANLLADAIMRDMRAVQSSVLSSYEWNKFSSDHTYRLNRLVASTFARNPYPESFFAWRNATDPSAVVFWNRGDRRPRWAKRLHEDDGMPVVSLTDASIARRLMVRVTADTATGQNYSVFETLLNDQPYQIVASLRYDGPYREYVTVVVGFLVNLLWVRAHYFADVTREMARVIGSDPNLALVIRDEHGEVCARAGRLDGTGITGSRQFALSFFDPLSLPPARLADQREVRWTAEAVIVPNGFLLYKSGTAGPAVVMAAGATLLMLLGLFLTARAVRQDESVAEARSSFVATVTHELKTPVAAIRAAGDTIASGRISTAEGLRDYALIVVNEVKRLTRLLDNLLAYARITDVTEVYSFESLDIRDIVNTSIREFRSRLDAGGYQLRVNIASDLPHVCGDRTGLGLVFDNILDNAIRYSKENRTIEINSWADDGFVMVEIVDRGIGIPADDLAHVTQRFFRGHNTSSHGSGLGLAIADRIITDHRGSLRIESTVGTGTAVSLRLPSEG